MEALSCSNFEDRAILYAAGELAEAGRAAVEAHAQHCAGCTAVLGNELSVRKALASRPLLPMISVTGCCVPAANTACGVRERTQSSSTNSGFGSSLAIAAAAARITGAGSARKRSMVESAAHRDNRTYLPSAVSLIRISP